VQEIHLETPAWLHQPALVLAQRAPNVPKSRAAFLEATTSMAATMMTMLFPRRRRMRHPRTSRRSEMLSASMSTSASSSTSLPLQNPPDQLIFAHNTIEPSSPHPLLNSAAAF